ncbi:MAG: hypothetical protein JWR83_3541, partial [Aeromicrobium sp.]|nr:hypothetical protein [Aeromicrobium sp.]
ANAYAALRKGITTFDASAAGCETTLTFDRAASRLDGMTLIKS